MHGHICQFCGGWIRRDEHPDCMAWCLPSQPAYWTPTIGWECPKCGMVYSPSITMCLFCGNSEVTTTGGTNASED